MSVGQKGRFMFYNCRDDLPEFQEIQRYQGLQNCYLGYHDLGELGEHAVYMYIIHTIAAFTTAWTQLTTSGHRLRNRAECMLHSNLLMTHIHAHTCIYHFHMCSKFVRTYICESHELFMIIS